MLALCGMREKCVKETSKREYRILMRTHSLQDRRQIAPIVRTSRDNRLYLEVLLRATGQAVFTLFAQRFVQIIGLQTVENVYSKIIISHYSRFHYPLARQQRTLTSIVPQTHRIVQRALAPPIEKRPQSHLHIIERQTVAHPQNHVHRTLGDARLVRVLGRRAQPPLIVEKTNAIGQRQVTNGRLTDDHRRNHRNRHIAAGLTECRLVAGLRIHTRTVYHNRCTVVRFRVRRVRVGRHADERIEADKGSGTGDAVDRIVELVVDVLGGFAVS